MTSNKEAVKYFTSTVMQNFPPPFRWEADQMQSWVSRMTNELEKTPPDVIMKAADDMVRSRGRREKDRRLPTVAECLMAVEETKKWLDAQNNKGKLQFTAAPDPFVRGWRDDEFANTIALNRRDPLCVQAAKEGWIGLLHTFVRKYRRMPDANQKIAYRKSVKAPEQMVSEIEWCKREAKDFDETYAKCVKGGFPFAKQYLDELGDPMLKKREELTDCVLHGVDWRKAA